MVDINEINDMLHSYIFKKIDDEWIIQYVLNEGDGVKKYERLDIRDDLCGHGLEIIQKFLKNPNKSIHLNEREIKDMKFALSVLSYNAPYLFDHLIKSTIGIEYLEKEPLKYGR